MQLFMFAKTCLAALPPGGGPWGETGPGLSWTRCGQATRTIADQTWLQNGAIALARKGLQRLSGTRLTAHRPSSHRAGRGRGAASRVLVPFPGPSQLRPDFLQQRGRLRHSSLAWSTFWLMAGAARSAPLLWWSQGHRARQALQADGPGRPCDGSSASFLTGAAASPTTNPTPTTWCTATRFWCGWARLPWAGAVGWSTSTPPTWPTEVFYWQAVIDSAAGGQQGCPLMTVCHAVAHPFAAIAGFSAAAAQHLCVASSLVPASANVAPCFADDGLMAGTSTEVLRALCQLLLVMPARGEKALRMKRTTFVKRQHAAASRALGLKCEITVFCKHTSNLRPQIVSTACILRPPKGPPLSNLCMSATAP